MRLVSQRGSKDAQRWVADMVSSASDAEQLYLRGVNLAGPASAKYGLPPLAQLRRLVVNTPLCPNVCSSIQLPVLQYLGICKGPGLPDVQALPTLDLSCCSALQDLSLENVLPVMLTLPPEEFLDFKLQYSPAMLENWEGVCDMCNSLNLKENFNMPEPLSLSRQLDEIFLSPCSLLCVLNLECKFIGRAELPLMLDLPNLVRFK